MFSDELRARSHPIETSKQRGHWLVTCHGTVSNLLIPIIRVGVWIRTGYQGYRYERESRDLFGLVAFRRSARSALYPV